MRPVRRHVTLWPPWLARAWSLPVMAFSLFMILMSLINEDPPSPQALPLLALLGLSPLVLLSAWRWEKAGGAASIVVALAQVLAAAYSAAALGLPLVGRLSTLFIFGFPPLSAGVLFLGCGLGSSRPGGRDG